MKRNNSKKRNSTKAKAPQYNFVVVDWDATIHFDFEDGADYDPVFHTAPSRSAAEAQMAADGLNGHADFAYSAEHIADIEAFAQAVFDSGVIHQKIQVLKAEEEAVRAKTADLRRNAYVMPTPAELQKTEMPDEDIPF